MITSELNYQYLIRRYDKQVAHFMLVDEWERTFPNDEYAWDHRLWLMNHYGIENIRQHLKMAGLNLSAELESAYRLTF